MDALTVWKLLNETIVKLKTLIETNTHAATSKTTPADADELPLVNSADNNKLYKLTWSNVKTTLAAYVHPNHSGEVTSVGDGAQTIAAKAVTLAKMADMATASLIYRKTALAGTPEINSLATLKTDLGTMPPAAHDQNASTIIVPNGLGTPAYDDVQDFLNLTRSAGRLTGGAVSKGTGATVSITAMEGMIFTGSTLGTSPLIYFKMPQQTDILGTGAAPNLIDNSVNWIYIDYAAGTPVYKATIDRSTINEYTMFTVARAWVSGATVEVQASGHSLYNKDRRSHNRLILKYGGMDRVSGATLSQHATALRIQTDAGSWYIANTPYTTALADTFTVMYRTGGGAWTESANLTLFSEVFDGGTSKVYQTYQNGTSLGTLSGSKYGVYWIFINPLGKLIVVLGTADYANIGAAQAATVPASLPARCTNWSRLIGRVICQKTAAAFYSVESVWAQSFTLSAATDHASLGNITPMSASGHPAATAAVDGYATATQITKLDGIEAAADVTDAGNVGSSIHGVADKNPPIDADKVPIIDTAAGNVLKTSTWTNIKAFLKTYFDGLYNLYVHPNHSGDVTSVADGAQTIGAKKVTVAMLADGTDGELITWGSDGVATVVANLVSPGNVLVNGGTGNPPYFTALLNPLSTVLNAVPQQAAPHDTDKIIWIDTVDDTTVKYVLFSVLKSTLKTYFDGIYAALAGLATQVFSVAAATAIAHAVRADQIQTQSLQAYTTGGTDTAFTLTTLGTPVALTTNERWHVIFNATAGSTPTLNRDSKGAKALKYYNSIGAKASCGAATIIANMRADVVYDGTDYVVLDTIPPVPGAAVLADGDYGDITVGGTGTTMTIDNNAVTLAKLATQAAETILANATSGAAVPTALALAEQTVLGRITGGHVVGLTATQLRTLANVADGSQVNVLEGVTGTAPIVAGAIAAKSQAISISAATTGVAGSMSAADKLRLNSMGHNYLINGGFDFWQRIVPTTATAMSDDVYNAPDRWYSLVQAANATINRNAGIGTSQYSCKLIAGGTTNRYGIAQIVEGRDSIPLRGQTVIAQCRVKPVNNAGSGTRKYRIALLEWTGTVDVVTSELVADWTSGTFTTAGFFASTTKTLVGCATVTATHNTETVLSVSGAVSASCNNLIVFIWAEDVPTHASDYVLIGEAGLFVGNAELLWSPDNINDEQSRCDRYCIVLGTDALTYEALGVGMCYSTVAAAITYHLPVKMRGIPAIGYTTVGNFAVFNAAGAGVALTGLAVNAILTNSRILYVVATVAAGLTQGAGTVLCKNNNTTDGLIISCEL